MNCRWLIKLFLVTLGILRISAYLPGVESSSCFDPTVQKKPAKINLNRATQEELMTLPGIGPALAKRVLDYRAQNPPFKRPEDLLILRGINRKLFDKIKDRIEVK
jgi:competence protein ComEA